jgi:hypothetical protein
MQWYGLAASAAVLLAVGQQPGLAAVTPKISKVTFTTTGSTFGATVTGLHFGAAPAGVPCSPCSVAEFTLTDLPHITSAVSYGISAWSDTYVTLTNITAPAADGVDIVLKNDTLKNYATWGGNFPGKAKNPKIKSVTFSGSGATLKITITGTGFGAAPAGVPGTVDIPYLNFLDWNVKAPGQFNVPWGAGWAAQGLSDTVTLNYASWTDTQIVINGFGGAYGSNGLTVSANDPYVIWLWQPPGTNPGSTGPQTAKGGRIK